MMVKNRILVSLHVIALCAIITGFTGSYMAHNDNFSGRIKALSSEIDSIQKRLEQSDANVIQLELEKLENSLTDLRLRQKYRAEKGLYFSLILFAGVLLNLIVALSINRRKQILNKINSASS